VVDTLEEVSLGIKSSEDDDIDIDI